MTYLDTLLAEPNLLHLWTLGGDSSSGGLDHEGSTVLTFGSIISWDAGTPGRVLDGGSPARFVRAQYPNDYVIGAPPALSGAHSVEVLIKIPSAPALAANGWYIFGTRGTASNFSSEMTVDAPTRKLRINLGNGAAWHSPAAVATALTLDAWHHVVLTVSAAGAWEIYLDGVSVGSGAWGLSGTPLVFDATHNLTIGNYGRGFDQNWAYEGWMQIFAMYDTALSAATVAAHYADLGSVPTHGLLYPPEYIDHGPALEAILLMPALAAAGASDGGIGVARPDEGQTWPR